MEYADLIGLPFEYGGRGPDSYDCYGLVKELLRRQGVEIRDYESPSDLYDIREIFDREIVRWRACEPKFGAVAYFRILGYGSHVGLVINPRQFIHIWENSGGVVVEPLRDWDRRLVGFYEYVG